MSRGLIGVVLTGISGPEPLGRAFTRLGGQELGDRQSLEVILPLLESHRELLEQARSLARTSCGRIAWKVLPVPLEQARALLRAGLRETAAPVLVHLDAFSRIGPDLLRQITAPVGLAGVELVGGAPCYARSGLEPGTKVLQLLHFLQRLQEVLASRRALLPGTGCFAFSRRLGEALARLDTPVESEPWWLIFESARRHGWDSVLTRTDLSLRRRALTRWDEAAQSFSRSRSSLERFLAHHPHHRPLLGELEARRHVASGTSPEQRACDLLAASSRCVSRDLFETFRAAIQAPPVTSVTRPARGVLDAAAPRLKIRGPFLGISGYEHHTREFSRHLAQLGVEVQLELAEGWDGAIRPPDLDPWFESRDRDVGAKICVHFELPPRAQIDFGMVNIQHSMFESEGIPPLWALAARDHERVLVASEASLRAWRSSGVPASKLRLSPLGVDTDRFHPGVEPLAWTLDDGSPIAERRFRFLNISSFAGRKNIPALLRVWLAATDRRDDAVLILKLGPPNPRQHAAIVTWKQDAERRMGRSFRQAAPIRLYLDRLAIGDMPRLHALATHYLSLSCGEGWDNPMIEAAAMNRTLITPRHSAYSTYLAEDAAHWIPATRAPAPAQYTMFRGLDWWWPDERVATERLREILDGKAPARHPTRPAIETGFTYRHAAQKMLDILLEDFGT